MSFALYLILAAVVVGLLVLLVRLLLKTAGLPCQFCRNLRCTPLRELPQEKQEPILGYFREFERREPDGSGIFVCQECLTVFDDFSGEKKSRDIDAVSFSAGPFSTTVFACRTFCKVCNLIMSDCNPENDNIRCGRCGTTYKWRTHGKSGFRFLMPPRDAKVLPRCRDYSLGTT